MNNLLLNCIVTTYLLVMAPVSSTIYSKIRSYTSALYFCMHSLISKLEYCALSEGKLWGCWLATWWLDPRICCMGCKLRYGGTLLSCLGGLTEDLQ